MEHSDLESPLSTSREECFFHIESRSVKAMHAYKENNQPLYQLEINTLAKICAQLITHHQVNPQDIINRMEQSMVDGHQKEQIELASQINILFNKRKKTPVNTFFGEKEIMKLTREINTLATRMAAPIKDSIQSVIVKSLELAIKVEGAEIPVNFNLSQYEYRPPSELDSPSSSL